MRPQVLEKHITDLIGSHIRDVTPGMQVRAYHSGKLIVDVQVGQTYPYYDLASLTKIIFTVQSMMLAFENKKWHLESKLGDFLPWFPHSEILVKNILSHAAGFVWWIPAYKQLDITKDVAQRRLQLRELILESPLGATDKSVYSDVGMWVLGYVLEEIYQKSLPEIWQQIKETFYEGTTLDFHPGNVPLHSSHLYAPTEECPWRQKLMRGEVHDENCWAMGGVSTHAGLFGSVDDVGMYLLSLRSHILGIGRSPIKMRTAQTFVSRARPEGAGDWSLGFMMPTPGAASCGRHFSLTSVGHLSFTGTSVWYDRDQDLGVVILSNRLLYGRDNVQFKLLRPLVHDWVVQGLRKASY